LHTFISAKTAFERFQFKSSQHDGDFFVNILCAVVQYLFLLSINILFGYKYFVIIYSNIWPTLTFFAAFISTEV